MSAACKRKCCSVVITIVVGSSGRHLLLLFFVFNFYLFLSLFLDVFTTVGTFKKSIILHLTYEYSWTWPYVWQLNWLALLRWRHACFFRFQRTQRKRGSSLMWASFLILEPLDRLYSDIRLLKLRILTVVLLLSLFYFLKTDLFVIDCWTVSKQINWLYCWKCVFFTLKGFSQTWKWWWVIITS